MDKKFLQRGVTPVIVALLVLVIAAVPVLYLAYRFISGVNNTLPETNLPTRAATPSSSLSPSKTATPAAAPAGARKVMPTSSLITTPASSATASGLTRTGWTYSGMGEVDTVPTFSSDRKTLYLDFEASSFATITSLDYLLGYNASPSGTLRTTHSSFSPATETISGYTSGRPYIRKSVTLGTCSQGVCTYDTQVSNFTLTVTVVSAITPTGAVKVYSYRGWN